MHFDKRLGFYIRAQKSRAMNPACLVSFDLQLKSHDTGNLPTSGEGPKPDLTPLLAFKPRATVWLWFLVAPSLGETLIPPALRLVLILSPWADILLVCVPFVPPVLTML